MTQKTVSFHTLGCKLNQAETDALRTAFTERGWTVVPFRQVADITVINSCTVTNQADRKTRSAIYQAVKASPRGKIAVIGCLPQVAADSISHIEGVDLILGNRDKFRIFEFLDELPPVSESPLICVSDENQDIFPENIFISSTGNRNRAFVKIQEGCANYCTFCVIPYARGKPVSRSFYDALEETKKLVTEHHYKEIILTGIDMGAYQDGTHDLLDLIRALERIDGLLRIRISSIEMNTLTDALIDHIAASRITAPHFHLSLQAGSDPILKAMNRKYTCQEFAEKVAYIRDKIPLASIGTDIITGFPGETESLFLETFRFIETLQFSYLHIFRFSPKKGTPAAIMKNQVSESEKIRRSRLLHSLDKRLRFLYASRFQGKTVRVLWESENEKGAKGFNEYYIQTLTGTHQAKLNEMNDVNIVSVHGDILRGRIL
ncbi:TPA: tRNA (N(6)-L-threonylcarbamoyladenosine(37)-C(2))-methylthiotransferase MtaB [Candidatus Marinimicrobia bacterium]|nr:MAG: RNA modification enzyme, MiaB family [Marinimicrobia bacterium 46_47]KUK91740.1 MAG: MiaB family RNA modification protein [Marinimicrobia bacterium 46_43]HAE86711.1 tRNA (N(6)-L-threonylcarbamoyladenosine(37)-C(2))-methylthiotransferase MtaB [Candidatus Neomarinimicrobiota bacterium]HBY18352.1 tRNA (N(6)-L-threonylcarbamoyladenosine(37)-C(2))-methylthiotransferase MtaB [Candidatus Neomarinimicrobiota bacterium]